MNQISIIKDDTVCDEDNAALLIEKICDYVGEQTFSISRTDKTDALKGYSIDFDEKP